MKLGMDLSFIRRPRPVAINLAALLARTSAAQSTSPTARAQVRLNAFSGATHQSDPHIALFAEGAMTTSVATLASSFAILSGDVFSPRKPS